MFKAMRPPSGPSSDDEKMAAHATLAAAQKAIQAKGLALFGAAGIARVFGKDAPWVAAVLLATSVCAVVYWVRGYRALRRKLGLEAEYDQLDQNITFGGHTLLILLGMFALVGLVMFLLVTFASGPRPKH
jgi:hypothetical protein